MNTQELTSLITRLEEEYGRATGGAWTTEPPRRDGDGFLMGQIIAATAPSKGCRIFSNPNGGSFPSNDARFIANAHNSMPTLLSALRHYMAVAEAAQACPDKALTIRFTHRNGEEVKQSNKVLTDLMRDAAYYDSDERLVLDWYREMKEALDTP